MILNAENLLKTLSGIKYDGDKDIIFLKMVGEIEISEKKAGFTLFFPQAFDPKTSEIINACEQAIIKAFGEDISIKGNIKAKAKKHILNDNLPGVKNIIAVASGKGGVGKSTVAVNLAVALALEGYSVGLLDADIFGPSLPKMFGVEGIEVMLRKSGEEDKIIPVEKFGVKMLSIGFFVKPEDALIWRGPMASNALKQLINQGDWGELDYLLIDLPPGTSDIHLTIVQELSVTGVVIVSTPQDVALADVVKGINMFAGKNINVPVLGIVENMAWFTPEELPNNKYYIFGKDGCKKLSEKFNIPLLGQIPIVIGLREGGDTGNPGVLTDSPVKNNFIELARTVAIETNKRNMEKSPTEKVLIK
ncbi:MAG: sodium:proton antiporter [Bacteroidetes bacterium GWF2_38_335]|nr:MAG: sodium:proton antiporter [Bacteroidetes bacterium GWF2_38_335]OFY78290.1 MAG: sodium:proton antiporter [Bacteroidetes bacterium RIFOXYA12_FULL_38_20]HBS87515.1 sodium:proton antiporter [Bacteroidales bacterium]